MGRLPLLALAVLLLSGAAAAAATSTPPARKGAVDPELLEFLADWQGADGSWVDPMTFTRIDPAKTRKPGIHSAAPAPGAASASPAAGVQAR